MIEIEKTVIEDSLGIITVNVKTWQTAYKNILPDEVLNSRDIQERTKSFKEKFDDKLIQFTAKENGEIVGFIAGGKSRDEVYQSEMYAYYILQEYQGKGIGKRLFKAFIEEAINRNYSNMNLWCLHGNKTAYIYEYFGGKYIKSKNIEIPKNSGMFYKEDMYEYPCLSECLKKLK